MAYGNIAHRLQSIINYQTERCHNSNFVTTGGTGISADATVRHDSHHDNCCVSVKDVA